MKSRRDILPLTPRSGTMPNDIGAGRYRKREKLRTYRLAVTGMRLNACPAAYLSAIIILAPPNRKRNLGRNLGADLGVLLL